MEPINFPESNFTFTAPPSMDNCSDLHVYKDDDSSVSLWRATWRERVRFLLTGKMQLHVWGAAHPPVCLVAGDITFEDN